ncbi:MAG: PfkB family carbohydrate kinase, partial [Clostridiales bacterium]|nr:PfkB family carbohydrate kinase [Clostridiales bacterium]
MAYGVFIGLAGLDIVYRQSLTPGENLKSKTNRYDLFAGGPAANAAVTYGILGGEAALITCIGDSAIGQTIKKEISEDSPVRILDCAAGQEILPCISSISVNVENGSRTIWSGQQVFQPCIGDAVLEAVREADFCLFDGSLTEVSKDLLPVAKAASRAVVLDMGSWKPDSDLF